ncbi:4'-phosphopantetheinyl transferase superfamily protein (plasmid) [Pantoea stewartii]
MAMNKNNNGFLTPIITDFTFLPKGVGSYFVFYDIKFYQDKFYNDYNIYLPEKIRESVIKRRAEFFSGRLCADMAMNLLGFFNKQVAVSPARVPLWPEGLIGSISHTDNLAIAVVAHVDTLTLIGVDLEIRNPEVFISIADQFTSTQEQIYLQTTEMPYDLALLITFSAKESLYKALWPEVNAFFDFSAAAIINIDINTQKFHLRLTTSLTNKFQSGTVFSGNYCLFEENVITLIAN